ncbi:MAG: hypothetical protein KC944_15325 [Candidatus Omnitrophica bacterium]|nr:hypothetical protein [Candidatus Omnitrophota bacterium]
MELKAMSIGGILDTALRLYKDHFSTFLMVGLIVFVPYTAVLLAIVATSGAPPGYEEGISNPGGGLGTVLYYFVVYPLSTGAMVCLISSTYLGRDMSATQSYLRALQRIGTLLLTNLLYGLWVFIGFLLLIVPGILFSLWYMLATSIVVLEGTSSFVSLGRSKSLMKGNLSKGFVLQFLVICLALIGYFGISTLVAVPATFLEFESIYLDIIMESFLEAFFLPFTTGAIVLLYYDLRVRKEAFDLEQLASEFEWKPKHA